MKGPESIFKTKEFEDVRESEPLRDGSSNDGIDELSDADYNSCDQSDEDEIFGNMGCYWDRVEEGKERERRYHKKEKKKKKEERKAKGKNATKKTDRKTLGYYGETEERMVYDERKGRPKDSANSISQDVTPINGNAIFSTELFSKLISMLERPNVTININNMNYNYYADTENNNIDSIIDHGSEIVEEIVEEENKNEFE